ncbi:CfaE/CblD family pilus tip adhesin [Hafnia alvei]|uniref:CfaE/CblD family pilus tip adhesin n=1 Tax=Hafnia alvei TaxID=569 RepID=UPI000E05500F|nr:CfaE/CblD family pilus tip adhesin [Hafnia alvei]STQ71701.1 Colonization factor antigen I subunit E [Hafnia alvei]
MNNGMKNAVVGLLFIISTMAISSGVHADVEQPTGRNTIITQYFDKQSIPSQVDIWANESGGYNSDNPGLWGRNSLICLSSSRAKNGQCPTVSQYQSMGIASIPIQFIEKRSKLTAVLNISGYDTASWAHDNGACDYIALNKKIKIYSMGSLGCDGYGVSDQGHFYAYLPQSELKKLPVGGVWEAELKMQLWQWSPYIKLGDWNAHIKLNVSDTSNQAIYFPSFGAGQGKDAQPHVDLNLRPLPGGDRQVLGRLNGSTSLDMCLYDGYGSNSRSFQVQLSEPPEYPTNPEGRQAGQFSVYNDTGNRNAVGNRIDYGVKMYFPGSNSFQDVVNGTTYTLDNINTDDIRAVRLASNISNVVLCVPTPLQITTPAFNIVDKTTGHYTGKIRVVFTPSLW